MKNMLDLLQKVKYGLDRLLIQNKVFIHKTKY